MLGKSYSIFSKQLASFAGDAQKVWIKTDPNELMKLRQDICRHHLVISTALCALTVKMDSFSKAFPHEGYGNIHKRADFLMSEIAHGIDVVNHTIKRMMRT